MNVNVTTNTPFSREGVGVLPSGERPQPQGEPQPAVNHFVVNPAEWHGGSAASDNRGWPLYSEEFASELQRPYLLKGVDPATGSSYRYNVYCFNQDTADPNKEIVVVNEALFASPSTSQGGGFLSETTKRLSRNLVVAFGCEGTRVSTIDGKDFDLETIARLRLGFVKEIGEAHGISPEAGISLVAESYGTYVAHQMVLQAQELYPDRPGYVKNLVQLAQPAGHDSVRQLLGRAFRGEIFESVRRRKFKTIGQVIRHAAEIIPDNFRQIPTHKRLLSLIVGSEVDIDAIDAQTRVTTITAERDRIGPTGDTVSPRANTWRFIVTGGYCHTDLLTDPSLCARLIEKALREPASSPSAA